MIRTLVVEDDRAVAEINTAYVHRMPQFTVVDTVFNAAAALDRVSKRPIDLVLLDFNLPDAPGLELCRAFHSRPSAPDVIAVTAARDSDTVRRAVSLGVVQYLVKPYTFATFSAKLQGYANYRDQLREGGLTDQRAVDQSLAALRGADRIQMPKGLSATTYDLVSGILRGAPGPLSANEVAATAGISRVSARRYLEYLCRSGLAEVIPDYGRVGRPLNRYGWSDRTSRGER